MTPNGHIRVIGLGSPIMTDDSIGLRVSEDIEEMGIEGVDCCQEAVGGLELLPLMKDYDYAVIVDAIQTGQYEPGTVLIFDVVDFESTEHRGMPAHDTNIATAIKIGRQMDPNAMPLEVKFVAMEIEDMQTMGEDLTPKVAAGKQSMTDAVLYVIDGFHNRLSTQP